MGGLKIIIFDNDRELGIINERDEIESLDFYEDKIHLLEATESKEFDVAIISADLYKDDKTILSEFINDRKIPVVIALDSQNNIECTLDGLLKGAFDYFNKPLFSILNETQKEIRISEIINKLIFAQDSKGKLNIANVSPIMSADTYNFRSSSKKLTIIGSSTGGPQSLEKIIPLIPKEIPSPIIIVQHMPEDFTEKFAQRLDDISSLTVKEAEDNETIKEGYCYIAKGNYHLEFKKKGEDTLISLNRKEKVHGTRPSVDITMISASQLYSHNLLGIILTGMGNDGTIGAKYIKENKGTILVQSEKTSIIFGMPKSVIDSGHYDEIVDLEKIPVAILQILEV